MASEQVRLASKALGPLLRRRGTSPALGVTLRQVVKSLDKALAETDTKMQAEIIREAISELRFGLNLIQNSQRPADHAQLEGAAKALSFLAPLEQVTSPEPARIPAPAPPPPPISEPPALRAHPKPLAPPAPPIPPQAPPAKAEDEKRPPKPLSLDFPTVRLRLLGLRERFRTLHVALTEPLTTLRDLDTAQAELDRMVQAVKWLGEKRIPAFLKASESAESLEERLVAHAALIHLGVPGGVDRMMSTLEAAVGEKQTLPAIAATILRTLADAAALDGMLTLLLKPVGDALGSLFLPLLAEQGALSSEQLLKLVSHPSDGLAVPAIEALAWLGNPRDAPLLLARARSTPSPKRADALLFAAVAIGSVEALAQVRARFSERADSGHHLVDALAIAGDDSDAARLTALAAQSHVDANYLIFAAANLGCMDTIQALPSFTGRVTRNTLEEARRMVLGGGLVHPSGDASPSPAIRRLRGEPWSVSGLLSCLAAPDELVQLQRRLALEVRVRTGLAPPTKFPLLLSATARNELVANWTAHFAKLNAKLKPGGWYCQGKLTKPQDKEKGAR